MACIGIAAEKIAQFLERDIHVLIADLYPPGRFDPRGVHGAIWEEITGQEYVLERRKVLSLASCESAGALRAHVEMILANDRLPDMPLYRRSGRYVRIPLETTYKTAWNSMPRVWKDVIETGG